MHHFRIAYRNVYTSLITIAVFVAFSQGAAESMARGLSGHQVIKTVQMD
jgi:hypothetical protein